VDLNADLTAWVERLHEAYQDTIESLFEVRPALGRRSKLVGLLQSWTRKHRLREHGHVQLMLALHECGRSAEALDIYRRLRGNLIEQVGLEPSARVQDLQRRILAGETGLVRRVLDLPGWGQAGGQARERPFRMATPIS